MQVKALWGGKGLSQVCVCDPLILTLHMAPVRVGELTAYLI